MVNVHDAAHNLANTIKESEEFKAYRELDVKIQAAPELKNMIDDFQKRQFELQRAHMSGGQINPDDMKKAEEMFATITKDPVAAEYFQAELRLSQMMSDVSKILGDAMDFRGVNQDN